MILRAPSLSDQRVSLVKPADAFGLPKDARPASSYEYSDHKREGLRVIETAHSPSKPETTERELSFEQVVAWLAVQDGATRSGCAAILASEVTQTHETAKNEGFIAGREAGLAAAAKEMAANISALRELYAGAEQAFTAEQNQMQEICVEIVAEAFTKIAGSALRSESAVVGAVSEVLARVKEGREIVIRVAREDLRLVKKHEDELASALAGRKLELLSDARVELGGCIVETKLGNLDGRLEVQLRELYETLRLAKSATQELI